ncbi:hypothetical protein CampHawk_166 [Bacillus phage CampHawk]|uniref:Uncharacterized protein n=1 Tax=Bacillus phage CampHawk TaxID=1406783 RepID=U5PT57_9CAUD|nr:hypothetical protein CampHawk_166 [Bacillus phage CampHawk]AGY47044.1 hypothetical protein CampHawk_166 [Bacillus phage CampHawk]
MMNCKKKVEVTQTQAQAIEEGKKHYLKMAHEDSEKVIRICGEFKPWEFMRLVFVAEHFLVDIGAKPPWEESFAPLNSISPLDLRRAIKYGYVIKEDVENGKAT